MSDSDSEDDGFGGVFSKLAKASLDIVEEDEPEEIKSVQAMTYGNLLDKFIRNDEKGLLEGLTLSYSSGCRHASALLLNVLRGEYLDVIQQMRDYREMTAGALISACEAEKPVECITGTVIEYVADAPSVEEGERRAVVSIAMGLAFLSVYIQMNFTGPELSEHALLPVASRGDAFHKGVLMHLECDGEFTYADGHIQLPHCLLIARCMLRALTHPSAPHWITTDTSVHPSSDAVAAVERATLSLPGRRLLSCRAAVFHLRVINTQSYEAVPTLWNEVRDGFNFTIHQYMGQDDVKAGRVEAEGSSPSQSPQAPDEAACRAWLEWGLAQHFFQRPGKGKKSFRRAQELARLECELTGAMGKRTKYQKHEHAQLYVRVKSGLAAVAATSSSSSSSSSSSGGGGSGGGGAKRAPVMNPNLDVGAADRSADPVEGDMKTTEGDSEESTPLEVGRRMVTAVGDGGEEAATREISLDAAAAAIRDENILFENGPRFSEARADEGTDGCHPLDQAILLGLCLDVGNSNPADGLTTEEMFPYVRKVLQQPLNWMIHSTGLLERSWLEFEKRKTMDRSLMQIQALLDQHTTRLTIFQSSQQVVTDSAPAHERISYATALAYPAQYELKRDLATRYLKCCVFDSALHLFREIELWDEVIKCYQLLQKPQRAEMIVREQLKLNGETPYLVTILGDLTQDVKYYERAWSLSKGRYARAKRTWAHVCFDKGDFHGCYAHMCDALAVQPFVNKAWYLKGVACMQLPKWDEALEAFHRCVNLDADVAEAWANMGAVHLKTGYPERALISLEEAMRRKRGCFKIQENILAASLQSGAFDRCLRCMEYLLQLRHKSKTNYYPAELRHLAMAVVEDKHLDLVNKMETFFVSVASAISPDAVYWDIRANFYLALTRPRDAVDCRVKHIRAVLATERWAYDGTLIALMSTAITCLRARVQESEAMSTDKTLLYTCHSLCKSAVQSARGIERDVDEVRNITALLSENQDYFDETMRGVE